MTAEILRDAADRLDALTEAATSGPWRYAEQTHGEWFGIQSEHFALGTAFQGHDAAHIAAMHPGVSQALAAWLRDSANEHEGGLPMMHSALDVARAVLGSNDA